jgi:membrane protein YdbS with pleckstrin-like domain
MSDGENIEVREDSALDSRQPAQTPEAAPPGVEPGSYSEFRSLDARVIQLWRVTHFIFFSVLLVAFLVAAGISVLSSAGAAAFAGAGCLLAGALFVWITFQRPVRLFHNWSYRISERVLETRSGIIFKVSRLLPLNRLQHVDLHRGPLERAFGLASLVLHTAGTHDATITIPGLDANEATRLRDHLIEVGGDDAV